MPYILIVDDDAPMRQMLSAVLRSAGYATAEAADGKEGARLFRGEDFDLIITDILMPERDGIEIIIEMKRERPEVPIIAMTGIPVRSPLYLKMAKQLGAQKTLGKPFTDVQIRVGGSGAA